MQDRPYNIEDTSRGAQTVVGQRFAGNGPNGLSYYYYYYYYYYYDYYSNGPNTLNCGTPDVTGG